MANIVTTGGKMALKPEFFIAVLLVMIVGSMFILPFVNNFLTGTISKLKAG